MGLFVVLLLSLAIVLAVVRRRRRAAAGGEDDREGGWRREGRVEKLPRVVRRGRSLVPPQTICARSRVSMRRYGTGRTARRGMRWRRHRDGWSGCGRRFRPGQRGQNERSRLAPAFPRRAHHPAGLGAG